MKKYIVFIWFIFGATLSKSQGYLHYFERNSTSVNTPTSMEMMTDRIKEAAIGYAKYAPVPRFAEMDYAFGADADEYKKLNGYGVLYVPSLNQDSSEYPIKRVFIRSGNIITELEKIGEIKVGVKDGQIKQTFGKNRVDYYYLIPYDLTQTTCELRIDWANNRKDFVLGKFPDGNKLDYVITKAIIDDKKTIDRQFLMVFLQREYNIGLN